MRIWSVKVDGEPASEYASWYWWTAPARALLDLAKKLWAKVPNVGEKKTFSLTIERLQDEKEEKAGK